MIDTRLFEFLYLEGDAIEYRLLANDREHPPQSFFVTGGTHLNGHKINNDVYNVYFGVNPRLNGSKSLVERVVACFTDCDAKHFASPEDYRIHIQEKLIELKNMNLYPSCRVNSGHGEHWYWKLKESPKIELKNRTVHGKKEEYQECLPWTNTQKALQAFVKGCSVFDFPRILRVPGTLNIKNEPVECKIIEISGAIYDLSEFVALEGEEELPPWDGEVGEKNNVDIQKAVVDVLMTTPGTCDTYEDFVRIAMALKSAGYQYEEVDGVFRGSQGYDLENNKKIYAGLKPNRITMRTAYYYAQKHNPGLLNEKIKGCSKEACVISQKDTKDLRPTIEIVAGKIYYTTDEAIKVLERSNLGIYQRFGELVEIRKNVETKGVSRDDGTYVIKPITETRLLDKLNEVISWKRWKIYKDDAQLVNSDAPKDVAKFIIERPNLPFPCLSGVIFAPTIRKDGSTLNEPGYDSQTGLFLISDKIEIPEAPTLEDAKMAMENIKSVISQFPFKSEIDKSVAVSEIFTILVRHSLKSAPLHANTAPKMRVGKTLLGDVASIIATGKNATKISQAKNEEEEDKRLLAVLSEGDPVIMIDNVDKPLTSDSLCIILTEDAWKQRLLGSNQTKTVSTCTTWFATGNNIQFAGDLSTRVVLCQLDPQMEHPEERIFDSDIREIVKEFRKELITCALIIVKAYYLAGKPKQNIKPFGGFEDWSNVVRSSIVWTGMPDPVLSKQNVEESDPERENLFCVLDAWKNCFPVPVTVNDAIKKIKKAIDNDFDPEERGLYETLNGALKTICGGQLDSNKIGCFIRNKKDRIEKGLHFKENGIKQRAKMWEVVATKQDMSVSEYTH